MSVAERLVASEFQTLELTLEQSLLTVTISRPEVMNALSPQVVAELRAVVADLRENLGVVTDEVADWSVRGIIITGAGQKAFVAGADIAAMQQMSAEESDTYTAETQELTSWIELLPVPVIAAVNGFALGGGCELAMACDYMFASANASFGQPEVALGLIPGFGGTVRLPQFVGVAAASELILTGRRIDAEEALRIGLIARVLPDADSLLEAARSSLMLAVAQSPAAVASAKRTMREARHLSTDAGLEVERKAFGERFGSPDKVEGVGAFLEKRKPVFPGI